MCHGAIAVRDTLKAHGLLGNATFPMCNDEDETLMHLLFQYPRARWLWNACGVRNLQPLLAGSDIFTWVQHQTKEHGIIFPIGAWTLWSARNRTVFEGEQLSLSSLFAQIMSLLHATMKAFGSGAQGVVRPRLPKEVTWSRADPATLDLNFDGSAMTNPGQTGCGGLV